MTKLKTFRVGLIIFIIGVGIGIYADMNTYLDNEGILHETFYTPISALFGIIGITLILLSIFIFLFGKKFYKVLN